MDQTRRTIRAFMLRSIRRTVRCGRYKYILPSSLWVVDKVAHRLVCGVFNLVGGSELVESQRSHTCPNKKTTCGFPFLVKIIFDFLLVDKVASS